jgi:transposase-like protein
MEVQPRKRRNLSRAEKLRILREYEALSNGGKGLFLRQQGIYSSNINAWRKLRDQKYLESAPKRGRKAKEANPLSKELAEAQRLVQKLQRRNDLLEKVIEVQKKISEITGIPLKVIEIDEND